MGFVYACVLTLLIEVPFLALWGLRDRFALTVTVCANVLTNLSLNLILALLQPKTVLPLAVGEISVVLAEYAIYARAFGRGRRLFLLTLAANCLSFGLGLLIMPLLPGQ